MTTLQIIKKIAHSETINEEEKIWYIKEIIGGWLNEKEISWIWEE